MQNEVLSDIVFPFNVRIVFQKCCENIFINASFQPLANLRLAWLTVSGVKDAEVLGSLQANISIEF